MLQRSIATVAPSVRPSVRLSVRLSVCVSHARAVTKRINQIPRGLRLGVAPSSLSFSARWGKSRNSDCGRIAVKNNARLPGRDYYTGIADTRALVKCDGCIYLCIANSCSAL